MKYIFSGHESFQCRHLWLKKGFDFLESGKKFSNPSSVVVLGVGKNMVASIRYWMKAFNLIDGNDIPNEFAIRLLSDNGWDPYIEDEGTIWLLHYNLIKKGLASTYSFIFNELRKEKIEFTKLNYLSFVKRKAQLAGITQISEKTLTDDFNVMVKMYIRAFGKVKDKEDSFPGLFTELDLIRCYGKSGEEYFVIENNEKNELPLGIFEHCLIDFSKDNSSISLSSIETSINSLGNIFAINRKGLIDKIGNLCSNNRDIIYSDHAGVKEIQFKYKEPLFTILEKYYAK